LKTQYKNFSPGKKIPAHAVCGMPVSQAARHPR